MPISGTLCLYIYKYMSEENEENLVSEGGLSKFHAVRIFFG